MSDFLGLACCGVGLAKSWPDIVPDPPFGRFLIFDIPKYRDIWYYTSTLLDKKQTANNLAEIRFNNYKNQPLNFKFPKNFNCELSFAKG